ncbi:hypothetical protein BST81_15600 [Leptolyngbya sp. 'hensonii']|uniref:ATP-binding protein n=1 Tax=Leptolyngbya sp. 'hensonii' TaxID=1922337 RepID=UPI00094F88E7|nr:ATP-binding protein [Leptolyngbya sp. 'hensonii']OLP17741.1 hypothetical protein BST81_15600 [Leptolyngbya sp. 'hensonii']
MVTPLHVLVVEDVEDDMILLLHELRRAGYAVTAERVETAAAMSVALEKQSWDLIISDYSLPDFSAGAALQLMKSQGLDLPFIIVSGVVGEETAIAMMKAGAHDYLLKGHLARLAPAIERELREAQIRREKRQAEAALLQAYEELEIQVQQRTAELTATNARLQSEMAERIEAGKLMGVQHGVTLVLAESATLNEATSRILETICQWLNWSLGELWLINQDADRLDWVCDWHGSENTFPNYRAATTATHLHRGIGLPGQVWESPQSIWIDDVATAPDFLQAQAAVQDGLHAACGVPVRAGSKVLGILIFFSQQTQPADRGRLGVMTAIGSQIGQFIQRRQVEESLHQLAAIVESSNDAILSTTIEGQILSWNPGAERMYGYTAAEAEGQNLYHLLYPADAQPTPFPLDEQQLLEQFDGCRSMHQTKIGRMIDVFLTISPLKDSLGRMMGISLIARDISEQQAIERMKNEFISVVSHELRTPLTSIRGSLGLLLTSAIGQLPPMGQRMLEIAVSNTDRLVRLINDFLDLERLESGQMDLVRQNCNAAELITQSIELMQAMADKAEVTLSATSQPLTFWADPDRIIQVLTNLLSNAIKFSPPGSTIWVKVEPYHAQTDRTMSPFLSESVLFTVQDQGRGIPADKLESIFGRFQQVDASDSRQRGGTGLGLAICRTIVQQHLGSLWVKSTLGEGSTFFLALPTVLTR